ncbi:SAC3/GANP/Nin1/mts3/eIF-3 p25 family-domain-containing protein [Chaetomium tenue]|uniref:SAC3/GANP/Nin1/mts3/eIF-3 p25 family-domain-containing protein n=1 Tax=Chaetomium tenue TaxID=1854479 RepID=A0ACB7PEW6_9PEZI|nr:SAC3/GANP/Nin1/mts3/eIF-3 p25 family-domain-containing protein [Chaetomium globosum]
MAAPANNPFGAPPGQVLQNPFGAPVSGQPASAFNQPFQNSFNAPAPTTNPFGSAPAANPFGALSNNSLGATAASGSRPSSSGSHFGASNNNPFGVPASGNKPPSAGVPFGAPSGPKVNNLSAAPPSGPKNSRSPSPFGSRAPPSGPSGQSSTLKHDAMGRRNKLTNGKPPAAATGFANQGAQAKNGGFAAQGGQNQGATPFASTNPFTRPPGFQTSGTGTNPQPAGRGKQPGRQERHQPAPSQRGSQKITAKGPTERTKQLSNFAFNYANKLYDHLKKENVHPPKWHADPGDPSKRAAIESLKESYKKYRTRAYATLRKADLIDDPDKRRKLEDALPFKGICENMCPEFEQVSRIAEYDVKTEEKEARPDGLTMWPDTTRMVKKFGRSAAGQDAPLPMDVRSVDALRRTTDYLFNDLLQSENNLPSMHNFLWDRTRAVRKDFTFHSQKSAEEMKDMVYCFETITRFHATALHLLSKKGFANEDFDQRQEIEQLGRTILSLMEAYDMCHDKQVHCPNEPEFRAYYLLLNAHDPSIVVRIPTWGKESWFETEEVQTALSLIQTMEDVREPKGPIKPRVATSLSDASFTNYFSIVEDTRVSYTMACVAEIHFTTVREGILKNLVRGYARHRDAPRTITASDLNAMLRFDTPEEAVEFAELHDFEFSTWVPEGRNPVTEPYLLLNNKKKAVPSPRVRQAFSGTIVERKRTTQSLSHVIYNTIFEEPSENPPSSGGSPDSLFSEGGGSLFVTRAPAPEDLPMANPPMTQPPTTSSPFGAPVSSSPFTAAATTPAFSGFSAPQPSTAAENPFAAPSQQPTPQGQTGQGPFPSFNQPPAPPVASTIPKPAANLGQSAQTGQTATSPFVTAKPAESSNPFAFLANPGSATLPSLAQAAQSQPSTIFSSAPPILGSTAPNPAAAANPTQATAFPQEKPATSTPSASILGTAPPAGASLFPTTTPANPPPGQQTATTVSSVPSIQISAPSATTTTAPATQGLQSLASTPPQSLGQNPLSGSFSQAPAVSFQSGATTAPTVPPPSPKRDPLGDFTKWFVTGDDGLVEQFTEEILSHILWGVWQDFEREKVEKKRRAEDEESWRVAREYQAYRLRRKFFYRWRNIARSLATKRILREGREKMRLYREQQKAAKKQLQEEKEKVEREARRAAKRQLLEDGNRIALLAASTGRRGSVAYSTDQSPEDQLLASGVFSGLHDDPRALARRSVRGSAVNGGDPWAMDSVTRSYRYPESELELEPAPSDTSSVRGKREGWKTRSLREKFGIEPRRSLSAGGSVVNANGGSFTSSSRFRQSLPGTGHDNHRTTNFSASRKRSAEEESDDEPGAKRQPGFYGSTSNGERTNRFAKSSTHWDLRARGFVPMPDGNWLPEAVARSSSAANNSNTKTSRARGRYDFASHSRPGSPDGLLDVDVDMASDAGRAPSPTPSELRLRLARIAKPRPAAYGHTSRHSVDLPRFTAQQGLLATSPPHPPLASGSMPPPPLRSRSSGDRAGLGMGKRKRSSEMDVDDDGDGSGGGGQGREVSPSAKKLVLGGGAVPDRAETNVMVENTKRMLRELREAMDRADREEPGMRTEVYLEG